MGFKSLKTQGDAKPAKDLKVGESIQGYLTKFITTKGKFGENVSPVIKQENGKDIVLWSSGNLKYMKEDIENSGVGLGVMVRITRVEPPKDKNYKSYFKTEFNPDDRLDVSGGQEEY